MKTLSRTTGTLVALIGIKRCRTKSSRHYPAVAGWDGVEQFVD